MYLHSAFVNQVLCVELELDSERSLFVGFIKSYSFMAQVDCYQNMDYRIFAAVYFLSQF